MLADRLTYHPDVDEKFYQNRNAEDAYDRYRESFPPEEDFVISILVNPCGANGTRGDAEGRSRALGYDCCMNRYGQGEYGRLKDGNGRSGDLSRGLEVAPSYFLAGQDEILNNLILVDEFGKELPYEFSRRADDHTTIDESCRGPGDPHSACLGDRLRAVRSPFESACTDHNQTVDATLDCYTPDGKLQQHCMQVSYAQTSYIFVCGGEFEKSERCGTFIEVHRQNGSPYDGEDVVLSDTQILTRVTSGMITTTIPLTYKGDPRKIICAYEETKIRVGSMVRISSKTTPTCCCPPAYTAVRKVGSFFCPRKRGTRGGPFADAAKNLKEKIEMEKVWEEYPYCHAMGDSEDAIMCSKQSRGGGILDEYRGGIAVPRFFTYRCESVRDDGTGSYLSSDLDGTYPGTCPLGKVFEACGSFPEDARRCYGSDVPRTFAGEVGKVISTPSDPSKGLYHVTFNEGRSTYTFREHELELYISANSYELWFVQRNRFEKIVQYKKPFKVVWPPCTFDPVNDRYFPYAKLDEEGVPLRVFSEFDGIVEEQEYIEPVEGNNLGRVS